MLLVDALLHELTQFGVKQLFGIPGDFVLPLFEQLQQRNKLPLYYLSHEPSAVFAADAAARISNKPSVVILTYGAGALNAVNAVAQAYVEHVPLVVIAGFPSEAEIQSGLQIHHQAKNIDSQRDIYREITACQVRLNNPQQAGKDIRLALKTAQEQSLPVLIEIPRDAVLYNTELAADYIAAQPDAADIKQAVAYLSQRLAAGQRPVIVAGVDVRRFSAVAELEALASKFNIPFISTLMGRACVNQQHPLYQGIFLDKTDLRPAQLLRQSDLILQIGVIKTDSNFAANRDFFPTDKVIEISANKMHTKDNVFSGISLKALLSSLLQQAIPPFSNQKLATVALDGLKVKLDTSELTTTSVVQQIDQQLVKTALTVPFVSDIGDCLFASLHANPSLMLAPAFYASMGYAVPAALGVQAVTGLRPLVLVGDGAFLMTGLELGHFARYGFTPIVVLFNNSGWDMINAFSPNLNCTSLNNWHYAELARSMGGNGVQVHSLDEFNLALAAALENESQFSLIEVVLSTGSRTERLNNFAAGFKAAAKTAVGQC